MHKILYTIKKILSMGSLAIAFIAIFTLIFTIYLIWVSVLLAGLAGLTGSLLISALAIFINIVNLLFLSPISLALVGANLFSVLMTLLIFIFSVSIWFFGLKLKLSSSSYRA